MEADPDQAEEAPIMMRSARIAAAGILTETIAIHAMRISDPNCWQQISIW